MVISKIYNHAHLFRDGAGANIQYHDENIKGTKFPLINLSFKIGVRPDTIMFNEISKQKNPTYL